MSTLVSLFFSSAKKKAFESKRKAHYNEFEMVKRMREKRQKGRHSSKDDGDDNDDCEEEE